MSSRVDVTEPSILIRINQLYRSGMSQAALYEATRGVWKAAAPRRDQAKYALAIAPGGIVCAVYEITEWHPAGTTAYRTRDASTFSREGRSEFTGTEAAKASRQNNLTKLGHCGLRVHAGPGHSETDRA